MGTEKSRMEFIMTGRFFSRDFVLVVLAWHQAAGRSWIMTWMAFLFGLYTRTVVLYEGKA